MAESDDLPYRAEYAKSNRAACKGCKLKIEKDTLRLAVMIQSAHFDGKQPNWFHYGCFFSKNRVKNVGDIAHFEQLRWEDQEKIKGKIAGRVEEKVKEQGGNKTLKDFSTEYAKSSRSLCRGCNEKILKGLIRISKKDYESEESRRYGPLDRWYHSDCFVKNRDELEFFASAKRLCGFPTLSEEDQQTLVKKLPEMKSAQKRANKSEADAPVAKKSKANTEEEQKLKKQNERLFKFRDNLQKQVSKKHMHFLLEANDQEVPAGEARILDRLSDCLVFGALESCPECKNGQLVYSREGYRCHGNLTEWTRCTYITQKPKRRSFEVDEDIRECYAFLSSYKSKPEERFFAVETKLQSSEQLESSSNLPLKGMKVALIGKLKKSKADLKKEVESLGGKVVTKIDNSLIVCISTEGEVKKMTKGITEAKGADVHVVSDGFLEHVKKGDVVAAVNDNNIADWGADLKQRLGDVVDLAKPSSSSARLEKAEQMFKSGKSKIKMTVKGGAAVDPDSELEDVAHVLEVNKTIYSVVLGLVDIVRGTNSYYKLQVLEGDQSGKHFNTSYWLFRSWGRVGTTIGGKKLETKSNRMEAIEDFRALYQEKTGNSWDNRDNFVKQPNLFYPLDIDYGQDDDKMMKMSDVRANSKSKLHKAIQDLICTLFDVESMKKTMVEFEIDLEKMPLGKLSRKQIERAYAILTELQELIQKSGSDNKFLDASNRFYTLIPHDFGLKKPTPLNNEAIITQKIDMLDNLLEIEVAYNLLKTSDDDTKEPIDAYYEKLQTDIEVLDPDTDEFKMIQKYVKNTHAATHNQYSLKVVEVFKVSRHGEMKRYKPFKKLHNRQLLWHGSRVTNYAGILSQGLRIAPPEAPVTGYMFGKGIYFADMVSKSANYCHTSKQCPDGFMLLSEVALGDMYELTHAEHITKLPVGKHSCKGLGRTQPDPKDKFVDSEGVEIPMGKGKDLGPNATSLLYNEYIVYDIAQVNVKYLLRMKFNWKF